MPDNTREGAPASITAVGLALASYPVGVERRYLSRAAAVARTLTTLRTFWESPQGEEPDATGFKGFFYHFLDLQTCRRTWNCELSTIDTTFLLAGALACAQYFDRETPPAREIRRLADALYRRIPRTRARRTVDRARTVFERAAAYANDLGLLGEEVDGATGELLGNFPQALSHVGLVNAAWAITQAQAGRAAPATEALR